MATATDDAPTARQLAADFFRDGKWSDPVEQLIFADYLEDRCGRPLDAALRRVLVEPGEDRHRLDYAGALEREAGRVPCVCAKYDGMRSAPPGCEEMLSREDAEGASTLSGSWHPCKECDDAGMVSDGRADRAEFVRVQVELATLIGDGSRCAVCGWPVRDDGGCEPDNCSFRPSEQSSEYERWHERQMHFHALRRRERELLDAGYRWLDWAEPLPGLAGYTWANHDGPWDWEFRRGFVASITCTTADLMAHAGAVFGAAPVEAVRLSDREPVGLDTAAVWVWWLANTPEFNGSAWVPRVMWDYLPGRRKTPDTSFHDSREDALSALSSAAVAFGRAVARLPPLPAP